MRKKNAKETDVYTLNIKWTDYHSFLFEYTKEMFHGASH